MIKNIFISILFVVILSLFLPKSAFACSGGTIKQESGTCKTMCNGIYQALNDYINGNSVCKQWDTYKNSSCTQSTPNTCVGGCSRDSDCNGNGAHCVNGRLSGAQLCNSGDSAGTHWCVGLHCGYDCKNYSCVERTAVGGGTGGALSSCQSSCKAPTPTPTPIPPPAPPTITSVIGCMAGPSSGNVATVNWSNNNVTIVDIGLNGNFSTTYNKVVTGSSFSTSAPTGFTNSSVPLTMQPNTNYVFRVYDGKGRSTTTSYTSPPLCAATGSITASFFDESNGNTPINMLSYPTSSGVTFFRTGTGVYTASAVLANTYTVSAAGIPTGYILDTAKTSPAGGIVTNGTNSSATTVSFFVKLAALPCTNTISGTVFEDANTDFAYTAGLDKLIGGITISVTDSTGIPKTAITTSGSGAYNISSVCAGSASVSLTSGRPIGDTYEYPTGSPPTYSTTVGAVGTCQASIAGIPAGLRPSCDNSGNVSNLQFALLGASTTAWFQSICGSMRMEPFSDPMPLTTYAIIDSLLGTTCTNRPGVVYSIPFPPTFDFGAGGASVQNWKVANAYTPKVTKTSYDYLTKSAISQNITYAAPGTCLPGTCTLAELPHGLYHVTGDTSIPGLTISTGNFIVLVSGNVTITGDILVSPGATLMIVAGGTLTVNGSVQKLQGVYVAGTALNILPSGVVCGADATQLVVQGSLIANANRTGGSFTNSRLLCSGNPGTQLFSRPDLLLNMPSFIKQRKGLWQELVP